MHIPNSPWWIDIGQYPVRSDHFDGAQLGAEYGSPTVSCLRLSNIEMDPGIDPRQIEIFYKREKLLIESV